MVVAGLLKVVWGGGEHQPSFQVGEQCPSPAKLCHLSWGTSLFTPDWAGSLILCVCPSLPGSIEKQGSSL